MVTERFPMYGGSEWIPGPTEMAAYDSGQKENAMKVLADVKAAADRLGEVYDRLAYHFSEAGDAETSHPVG